ncbi:hypothetical protein [Desemzia sp. FAM 24101]
MSGLQVQHKPNAHESAVYKDIFPLYRKLSRQFAEIFDELNRLQKKINQEKNVVN